MGGSALATRSASIDGGRVEDLVVSIVIPCLNEERTLGVCIDKANGFLARANLSGEVIVADNGSTDRSIAIAGTLGARVVNVDERGYGAALRGGIEAARGRYVVMGDADDSYDFSDLDKFVDALDAGADLVMGNRFKGGIDRGAMPPLHRYLGNPVLSMVGRLFFRVPVGDFHCGLRAFRRTSIQQLGLRTSGMEFASEMVVQASLRRYRIAEVPTRLSKDGRDRPPHLNTWRDGWRHLKFLMLHSPRWTFGYPGLAFLITGLAIVAMLLPGQLMIGGVGLDIRTFLLGCLAICIGSQALALAFLARRFANRYTLLPSTSKLQALTEKLTLERVAQGAGVIGLAGLIGVLATVGGWAEAGFGPLEQGQMMRVLALSTTAIIVAMQLLHSAFLLGIIDIPGQGGGVRAQQAHLRSVFPSAEQ